MLITVRMATTLPPMTTSDDDNDGRRRRRRTTAAQAYTYSTYNVLPKCAGDRGNHLRGAAGAVFREQRDEVDADARRQHRQHRRRRLHHPGRDQGLHGPQGGRIRTASCVLTARMNVKREVTTQTTVNLHWFGTRF